MSYVERTAQHSVYRMYDSAGTLLYVGCTGHLPVRLDQHRQDKPWWAGVSTVEVEHFPNFAAARAAEAQAIRDERPVHNRDLAESVRRGWAMRKARQRAAHEAGRWCNDAGCAPCKASRFGVSA